ncbi:MAG: PKD domain-containing protein, partial [Flammeovirgaceae bacterium]|nr:PKD domain-containing protein [Flammeovirgaceae bacterium]
GGNVVILTMTVSGNGSCASAVDTQALTVTDGPTADAGAATAEECDLDIQLLGIQSLPGSTVSWSVVTGNPADIIFSNVNLFNPIATSVNYGTYTFRLTEMNGSCLSTDDIVVTYYEKPVGVNSVEANVCSDVGFSFNSQNNVNAGNSIVSTFTWTASYGAGLTGGAGAGTNNIAETLTNITSGTLNAIYTIIPTGPAPGFCVGNTFTVTVPITPEPLGSNATASLCSGSGTLNYDLQANITANNGLASTFSWLALVDNTNVSGESLVAQNTAFINDNLINTTNTDQVVVYTVTPISGGCTGNTFTVTVTVQPEPVGVPITAARCSDTALGSGFTLNTNGTSVSAATFNIVINPNGLTQSAGTVSSGPGKFAIELIDDEWRNQTGSQVSVIYTIIPVSSAGCLGQPFLVTVNVDPEPVTVGPIIAGPVCSDVATMYNLVVAGASTFTISTNSNGLIQSGGTVSAGSGKLANELADDIWTNTTGATINIVYTITPLSGICNGDVFTVTIPITPEPFGSNSTQTSVCSNVPFNFDPQGNITNGIVSSFTWNAAYDAGLTGGVGSGINNVAETLINTTGAALNATYTIIPTGSGCTGNSFLMVVPIRPEPVGLDDSKVVCSDVMIGYNLLLNVATLGNNLGSTFSWVATDNVNPSVTGESVTPQIGPVITDVITNLTNTDQNVTYTVTPTGTNGCVGSNFDITITIQPEPVGFSTNAPDICSESTVGYNLQNNIITFGNNLASNFSWIAAANPNVTGESTFAKTGPIIDDVLTNTTTVDQIVVYTVTPSGQVSGCFGNPFTINVTVNPKAIFSAGIDQSVCVVDGSKALLGTSAFAPGGLLWSGGTGTFSNSSIANPIYTLSAGELAVTSPLNVTLSLMALGTGACPNLVDQMVLTINPQPIVTFSGLPAGAPPQMAENNTPITLTGNQVGGIFTIVPVTSNIGSTVPAPVDKALFDPSAVDLGSNFITYTYTDINGCVNSNTQEVIVNPVTNVDFTMQFQTGPPPFPFVPINAFGQFEVCSNVGLIKLVGNPVASTGLPPETAFTSIPAYAGGPVASITFDGVDYYMQTDGLVSDTYRVLYTYKNAFNAVTTKIRDVKIFASPVAGISVLNTCIDSSIVFNDNSSLPASPFPSTINGWLWNFGDGPSSSIAEDPSHNYTSGGNYTVTLRATTSLGCSSNATLPISVGAPPQVDFAWSDICNFDNTKFVSSVTNLGPSVVTSYTWDFDDLDILGPGIGTIPGGTHSGRTFGTFNDPEHTYVSIGSYDVRLTVTTDLGCTNSKILRISILPSVTTVTPSASTSYLQDFEADNGGWIEDALGDTSWIWGPPTGVTINSAASGTNAWWTGRNTNSYYNNEQSVVNGPCFDLTQLNRPMVTLDYWSDAEDNLDGAVLQYSVDGGISWRIVGPPEFQPDRNEGIEWFNGNPIASNPGSQLIGQFGWTKKLGSWKNGRFHLDMIPVANRSQVRLRIAFASNGSNDPLRTFDGFAFDNFFVGEKRRNVLVEHFTSQSPPLTPLITGDTYLDNLYADQIAFRSTSDFSDIRYHIAYPSPDAINQSNPADPASRALFYGISQPPTTLMDGLLRPANPYPALTGIYSEITRVEVDRRALVDPQFELTLDTTATNVSNTITVNLHIQSNITLTDPIVAHVALIENVVGTANNVVRKQLFGPDGETITQSWTPGLPPSTRTRSNVEINVPISDPAQLRLVGFILNKNTKEIYQSVVIPAPRKTGSVVVGIEDEPISAIIDDILIYPNPVNGVFNLVAPESLAGTQWKLADQNGKIVREGDFRDSGNEIVVDVQNLANGVYVIIFSGTDGKSYRKRLVIMNRN